MNANHELERRLADYYASEAPQRAPDRVLESVLAISEITRQRRAVFRSPWRFPIMNSYAKMAIAAVAVIAIGAVGLAVLRPGTSPGVRGLPAASPSMSPPPTVSPSASFDGPLALTKTFTSERHGFSISYPTGWVTRPATEPWTGHGSGCVIPIPCFVSTDGDVIYDPVSLAGNLWIVVASQPLGGTSGEQWEDDLLAVLRSDGICEPPIEPVTIDDSEGKLCSSATAVTRAGDRGYLILLYVSGDDPTVGITYDQAFFNEMLATVQLIPEDAVDTASSSAPSASP